MGADVAVLVGVVVGVEVGVGVGVGVVWLRFNSSVLE